MPGSPAQEQLSTAPEGAVEREPGVLEWPGSGISATPASTCLSPGASGRDAP